MARPQRWLSLRAHVRPGRVARETMTRVIDPAQVAEAFRDEIRSEVAAEPDRLLIVGLLAGDHAPSKTYAAYAERACRELGVSFELRRVERLSADAAIAAANADPHVDGVMVYYPI